jgi:hypothetical protein
LRIRVLWESAGRPPNLVLTLGNPREPELEKISGPRITKLPGAFFVLKIQNFFRCDELQPNLIEWVSNAPHP